MIHGDEGPILQEDVAILTVYAANDQEGKCRKDQQHRNEACVRGEAEARQQRSEFGVITHATLLIPPSTGPEAELTLTMTLWTNAREASAKCLKTMRRT